MKGEKIYDVTFSSFENISVDAASSLRNLFLLQKKFKLTK